MPETIRNCKNPKRIFSEIIIITNKSSSFLRKSPCSMGKSTISTGPWLQVRKLFDITRPGQNHHLSLFQAPSQKTTKVYTLMFTGNPTFAFCLMLVISRPPSGKKSHGKVYGDGNHLHKYGIFYS
jgi:hypothetical protein